MSKKLNRKELLLDDEKAMEQCIKIEGELAWLTYAVTFIEDYCQILRERTKTPATGRELLDIMEGLHHTVKYLREARNHMKIYRLNGIQNRIIQEEADDKPQ